MREIGGAKNQKLKVMVLMLIFSSMTLIPMLMEPLAFPLAVKMSGGEAVNMAVETLMENGLKPIVVTYGSPMYHLLIWKACAGVIWIGHGDKSGVFLGGEKLSWEEFANYMELTPSTDIILSCYSGKVSTYTKDVITFGEFPIDAIIGANLVSFILTKQEKFLSQALKRATQILNGIKKPILLDYVVGKLSMTEASFWMLQIIIVLFLGAFGRYIAHELATRILEQLAWEFVVAGHIELIVILFYYGLGYMNLETFIAEAMSVIHKALKFMAEILFSILHEEFSWLQAAMLTSLIVAAAMARYASGEIVTELIALLAIAIGVTVDFEDPDTVVG